MPERKRFFSIDVIPKSVGPYMLVRLSEFPFCQHLWDLTNHWDDIAVADMVADMATDMEVGKVADKVAVMVANMAAEKK